MTFSTMVGRCIEVRKTTADLLGPMILSQYASLCYLNLNSYYLDKKKSENDLVRW